MSRLAYDDESVVHAESGDWVAFPCDLSSYWNALAETMKCAGIRYTDGMTVKRDWLKPAPADETPTDYDIWWIACGENDPEAVAFWVCG